MPTRTVVYNLRIETDIGLHALPVTKLKIFSLLLVHFLDEYKFSSLVMGRNMDYRRSFRIKIRTPEIIIFGGAGQNKFKVYDNLFLLLTMSALKCYTL